MRRWLDGPAAVEIASVTQFDVPGAEVASRIRGLDAAIRETLELVSRGMSFLSEGEQHDGTNRRLRIRLLNGDEEQRRCDLVTAGPRQSVYSRDGRRFGRLRSAASPVETELAIRPLLERDLGDAWTQTPEGAWRAHARRRRHRRRDRPRAHPRHPRPGRAQRRGRGALRRGGGHAAPRGPVRRRCPGDPGRGRGGGGNRGRGDRRRGEQRHPHPPAPRAPRRSGDPLPELSPAIPDAGTLRQIFSLPEANRPESAGGAEPRDPGTPASPRLGGRHPGEEPPVGGREGAGELAVGEGGPRPDRRRPDVGGATPPRRRERPPRRGAQRRGRARSPERRSPPARGHCEHSHPGPAARAAAGGADSQWVAHARRHQALDAEPGDEGDPLEERGVQLRVAGAGDAESAEPRVVHREALPGPRQRVAGMSRGQRRLDVPGGRGRPRARERPGRRHRCSPRPRGATGRTEPGARMHPGAAIGRPRRRRGRPPSRPGWCRGRSPSRHPPACPRRAASRSRRSSPGRAPPPAAAPRRAPAPRACPVAPAAGGIHGRRAPPRPPASRASAGPSLSRSALFQSVPQGSAPSDFLEDRVRDRDHPDRLGEYGASMPPPVPARCRTACCRRRPRVRRSSRSGRGSRGSPRSRRPPPRRSAPRPAWPPRPAPGQRRDGAPTSSTGGRPRGSRPGGQGHGDTGEGAEAVVEDERPDLAGAGVEFEKGHGVGFAPRRITPFREIGPATTRMKSVGRGSVVSPSRGAEAR